MNQWADVVYAYSPTNDDELELKVGDKIEVIGFEEEGWWRGRLKGRTGVFPSNFVQVIDTTSPTTQGITSCAPTPSTTTPANKLNLFGTKTSKTSLSSNSLNSNNSNNNNNNNNNNMMNNTQHQDNNSVLGCGVEDSSITSSERRPKPIRGVGYGDIFASGVKTKPLPADPVTSNLAAERPSLNVVANNILQKSIPKKLPPPTPTNFDSSNGTSTDQAPALPPKPANQFSPLSQQHSRPLPPPTQQHPYTNTQTKGQARVIYAYEPTHPDELAIQVDDIIDIIDKDIDDAGWWKGELRGKIGVFPDNFVQLIEPTSQQDSWQHNRASQPTTPSFNNSNATENKIKSVFATTPKGFSKELENNLEKHSSPASFLSLKRNKLQQQQMSLSLTGESGTINNENAEKKEDIVAPIETNITKLNHITANRAKGPSRRPPSNILNKRNQLDQGRIESNGRDDPILGSLPINSATSQSTTAHDTLSSLPAGQHTTPHNSPYSVTKQTTEGPTNSSAAPIKPSSSLDNVIDNQSLAPKTSLRATQPSALDKGKPTSTPAWMVELRKAHAGRKRDSPIVNPPSGPEEIEVPPPKVPDVPQPSDNSVVPTPEPSSLAEIKELKEQVKQLHEEVRSLSELKSIVETMRTELKACQNATENQKRYIKELVNNLADERKKIAAMQVEIDRNLK